MIGSLLFLHQSKAADYYLMFAVCPMEVDVGESAFPVSSGFRELQASQNLHIYRRTNNGTANYATEAARQAFYVSHIYPAS